MVDHLTSDVHDDRLANSVHAKTYHLAPGYSERQKERDQIKAKRAVRKDGGEKRSKPDIKEDSATSRKKRRADFSSLPVPELLPGPLSAVLEQEETKRAYVSQFLQQVLQCGLPVHATEHLLPYLRQQMKDGGWLPATAEGLRAGYLDSVMLQQERNLLDHVLEDREYGLTVMLDESSDQAADRAPLNIIIVSHRRVYFMDTLFLEDGEACAEGVGKRFINWWTTKMEARCPGILLGLGFAMCRLLARNRLFTLAVPGDTSFLSISF